jgi:uncharacterized protein (DUF362 family)
MIVRRRDLIPAAGIASVAVYAAIRSPAKPRAIPAQPSAVAIVKAASYEADLVAQMARGVAECGLSVRGKRILLKPNLVEFDPATCINTDARVVAAAIEVFEKMGAAEVLVGEGPGHRRDTWDLAEQAGYRSIISNFDRRFTDLNRDDVGLVKSFIGTDDLFFPASVLRADLIVSLAKMKTHHWAGATLSMKNFFGIVPGNVYGWPKNQLHFYGINESIVALHRVFGPKSFAIVDGIVGMEGNGPIQGIPKPAGVLVMGSDLVAVDSTCCRIMGLIPEKIGYLTDSSYGNLATEGIRQRGESVTNVTTSFQVLPAFKYLLRG